MNQSQLIVGTAVCAISVLVLPHQADAQLVEMVFSGNHVENGVPLTYSGFGEMDLKTGLFFYTWDFSPEPFAKTTIMTNDPWGKKSLPPDENGFSLYEFSGFDVTVEFFSSDQFGNFVEATIEISGMPLITMDITSTSTTNLGPAPITEGIVPVTTDETDFFNGRTPGVVHYEGIQLVPVAGGGTAMWEYTGTYTLNGNPGGVIPGDILLHGDYDSILETSTIEGTMTVVSEPCPWDIDGDGNVGASDLLALLFTFGPCDKPCPPSCPADFDGNCTVGASDLLALLFNWGPCP